MALPIGTILDGKFKIVQVLGEGGMGTVYKVEQAGTPGTPPYYYAVKELLLNQSTSTEERKAAIERFNKEITLLRSLKHPRIPSLMLPFQERGNYYFVMEFVPGRSLEKILEDTKGPLNEEDVIKWMALVCEALSYIHSFNPPIILRDLKPGNVMVTPDGNVQLIDFGIARRFDPNKRTNTENLGTISYASPEHLGSLAAPGKPRNAPNSPKTLVQTDARSDIYSLGATMYHLLTNYEPDPIQTPAQGSIRAKNPRLRTIRVGNNLICPVEQVIIKAMQQNPAQRFQSADAMHNALLNCLPNYVPPAVTGSAPATVQIPAVASPNATVIVPLNGIICPKCGFQNRAGAKFCKRDGQPLLQGATVVPPQVRLQPVPRVPIRARPVVSPAVQARPISSQPIKARPVGTHAPSVAPAVATRQGLQYFNEKNYLEAIKQFQLALASGKLSSEGYFNLGRAYRQYGLAAKTQNKKLFNDNLRMAAEQFQQAIRLKPDAVDAFFQLGMCYRELAMYEQAATVFKRVLQLIPQQDVGISAVYYQLGMVAMEQGHYQDAERYFREGLDILPSHAGILIALGHLYNTTNQPNKAIDSLRRATQHDPAAADGWYELGRAYMKVSDWKTALKALEEAYKLNLDSSHLYSAMAMCYLKIRKKQEAKQKAGEALQRDAANEEAKRVQRLVS